MTTVVCRRCGFDRVTSSACPRCGQPAEAQAPAATVPPAPVLPFAVESPARPDPGPPPPVAQVPPPAATQAGMLVPVAPFPQSGEGAVGGVLLAQGYPQATPAGTPVTLIAVPIAMQVPPAPATAPAPPSGPARPLVTASPPAGWPQGVGAPAPGGSLLGAAAMMPPDEQEEARMAGAGRPSWQPSPAPPAIQQRGDAPLELSPEDEVPASPPSPAPSAPPRPVRTPTGPGAGARPLSIQEMPSIPLGRHENAPSFSLPPAASSPSSGSGQHCKSCGAAIYATMIRCPHCNEAYEAKRSSGPSLRIRAPERKRNRALVLVIGAVVSMALVGAAGFLVYYLNQRGDSGADTPDEAVRRFYASLFAGRVKESVQYLRPGQQRSAKEAIALLEGAKIPLVTVARRVIQTEGMAGVDFELGGKEIVDGKRGRVEVLIRHEGLPMRRTWMPVVEESGRWYVDSNPFSRSGR